METSVSLERASIVDEAVRRAGGATDFGAEPFLEPMQLLLHSLAREASLTPMGRTIARETVLGHAVHRLLFIEDRRRYPQIACERISKPVFIIGLPRTGTTILHDIFAKDPGNRVPMTWECMFPSPPTERKSFTTDARIAACEAMFPDIDALIPGFKAMHPMGAMLSQECVSLMADTFRSPIFHNQFRVPSYQDWVDRHGDWAHVYDFHEWQLQHFQWRCPGERWILKTGAHLWGLEHLLAKYPDARLVFTHRDPVKSMTSYASLTALVRSMASAQVDPHEVARDWTPRLLRAINHAMEVRDRVGHSDALIYEMFFDEFIEDQFAQVEKIYDAFGLEMTGKAADAMRRFIDENPPGVHGVHSYTPEQFGIDPAAVRRDFSRYIERFGVAPE